MHTQYNQKTAEFFGEEDLFTLEKIKTGIINNPYDFRSQAQDPYFQDIFCGKFAPNISTLSISTRSNVSYDNFDISSDFFVDECLQEEANQYYKPEVNNLCNESVQILEPKTTVSENEEKKVIIAQNHKDEEDRAQMTESSHDETKNIPKNYIKAIFAFILDNHQYIHKLFNSLKQTDNTANQVLNFVEYVRNQKKIKKYTIERLKTLWMDETYGKVMRIISNEFLRKRCLGYISSSKIQKKIHHIRYRHKFIKAVEKPQQFTNIK